MKLQAKLLILFTLVIAIFITGLLYLNSIQMRQAYNLHLEQEQEKLSLYNEIIKLKGVSPEYKSFDTAFWMKILQVTNWNMLMSIVFVALLMIFLFITLARWVNVPLDLIEKSLNAEDPSIIEPLRKDRSEFGRLAGMIIGSFQQKKELQVAYKELQKMDKMKTDFLSTVSHELRTPLTSVLGFAEITKKKLKETIFPRITTDDKKVQKVISQVGNNLEIIAAEGSRLATLINDLLDIAKMEAGKVEWKSNLFSVEDVIDHATAATAALFKDKKCRLIKEVEPDLPEAAGDRDRIIQVVINLISNASKFTEEGFVECKAVRREDGIIISVIDTGMGIPKEDHEKIFDKFSQSGDVLTGKPVGTGLGLTICKQIVEHHGGKIWVESEPGEGSIFSFTLPFSAHTNSDSKIAPGGYPGIEEHPQSGYPDAGVHGNMSSK